MAVVVVLAPSQQERAAAMRGKALVLCAILLSFDICATSAQSLFEQKAKCQKFADDFMQSQNVGIYWYQTYKSNLHPKLGNCYILVEASTADTNQPEYKSDVYLYDAVIKEHLAFTKYIKRQNGSEIKSGMIYDSYYTGDNFSYDAAEKYIADKMKTER